MRHRDCEFMMMNSYRYQPLPPIENVRRARPLTRVMCLIPGVSPQPLECTLTIVDLNNLALRYEALSYVWGIEKAGQPLLCHGGGIPITRNLSQALEAMRHPTTVRWLWVDAVCINQQDLEERVRQIGYMRLVYASAGRVVVWLGPEKPAIKRALHRARELCEYAAVLRQTILDSADSTVTSDEVNAQILKTSIEEIESDIATPSGSDLMTLFDSTYFERVWCIQEVVASKACICKSGHIEFNFYDLLSLARPVVEWQGLYNYQSFSHLRFWGEIYRKRFEERRKEGAVVVEGAVGNMLHALINMRNFQATDPRDRLFAIFGITEEGLEPTLASMDAIVSGDAARRLVEFQKEVLQREKVRDSLGRGNEDFRRNPALTPNYTKSVIDVYIDFTRFMVSKSPRVLDVLSHVQHTHDPAPFSSPWPSWVPRFDQPQMCSFLPPRVFIPGIPFFSHQPYFAELHDCQLRVTPVEPRILRLDGFRVDEVAAVCGPSRPVLRQQVPVERLWSELFAFPLYPRTKLKYMGTEQLDTAFLLTLCAGGLGFLTILPGLSKQLPNSRLQYLKILEEQARNQARIWLSANYGFPESDYPDMMLQFGSLSNTDGNLMYYNSAVHAFIVGRRVFRTSRGYLGLGPEHMKPGDHVVSLLGGHLAYILRQVTRTDWVFVGDCYLRHFDLMTGKMAQAVREGRVQIPIETFRLV